MSFKLRKARGRQASPHAPPPPPPAAAVVVVLVEDNERIEAKS
jgi:hypothetical protein